MRKMILVIDEVYSCMDCPLRFKDGDTDDWFRFRCHMSKDQIPKEGRLNNCELKPLPEKVETPKIIQEQIDGWHKLAGKYIGWNACIDELLGETE